MEIPFQPLVLDQPDVWYEHGPDSAVRAGVEPGTTTQFTWDASETYPGTTRRFGVHIPARYDGGCPAQVAIFQDGWWYLDPRGQVRAAIVLDNLVDRGEIPVTIGVFVDPGSVEKRSQAEAGNHTGPRQRNVEYDAFDDRYADFLLGEIMPTVSARWVISEDPDHWLIAGGSSGGNCALTAAWLRSQVFGHVICCLGSFAQIPGGNPFPELIHSGERRPLQVFLQVGDGGHNPNHAGVLLPDALRWHWRGHGTGEVA